MTQTTQPQPFNPNDHVIEIKTKNGLANYLPVQWRLVWFRQDCPEGKVTTEKMLLDPDMDTEEEGFAWNDEKRRSEKVMKRAKGFAVFHAHVEDGKGGIGEGTKSEKAASFADYIEKAETGAIGRALAALGYGTQFAPDFEGDVPTNPVDSPVLRSNESQQEASKQATPAQADTNINAKISKLMTEFADLFPLAAKKEGWQKSLAQRVWGEVPQAYTLDHYRKLNAYYLEHKSTDKPVRA